MVAAGLIGVLLSWMLAPLPAFARDWATLAVSLVPIGLLTGTTGIAGAVAFALLFWLAGGTRWTSVNRLLLAIVTAVAVAVPLLWLARLSTDASVPMRFYVGAAIVMGVVRGLSYAASRRRLRLVDHLVGMLFFPTFASGPIVSASALARTHAGRLAPATLAELARHLAHAGAGALRVAWGTAKMLVAPLVLNLVTPDVIASSGDAVSRLRLWAWLFETSLYFWAVFSGLSDVGIGLAAMVGVRVPENFVRPWAAVAPRAFLQRTLVTVTTRIRDSVAVPIARRAGVPSGVLASFLVGALWYSVTVLALYGAYGVLAVRPGAWVGLGLWAAIHAAGVIGFDRFRVAGSSAVGRIVGCATTQLLVALAWVPLLAFPFGTLGTILRIYARLVGFR
jgi:D-alanyl-lipoteichoic acid acyltransferase DltB (MBOAT superfamily)